MKNLITCLKSNKTIRLYGLIVLGAICLMIVLLTASYGNGVISTDFVIR